jgi:hypothetical protein
MMVPHVDVVGLRRRLGDVEAPGSGEAETVG